MSQITVFISQMIDDVFADALEQHRRSAILHMFVAQYMQVYRQNTHVELLHLSAAEAKNPAFDVSFWLYQRRRQINQDSKQGGNVAAMSVVTRIKFERARSTSEKCFIVATEKQVRALYAMQLVCEGFTVCECIQAAFWMELMKPKPSLVHLDETGRALELSISTAVKCFDELLEMAPSATIMRKYAEFLTEVCKPECWLCSVCSGTALVTLVIVIVNRCHDIHRKPKRC